MVPLEVANKQPDTVHSATNNVFSLLRICAAKEYRANFWIESNHSQPYLLAVKNFSLVIIGTSGMWSTNSVIDSALGQFFASDFGHGDDYDQLSSENLRSSEIRADASLYRYQAVTSHLSEQLLLRWGKREGCLGKKWFLWGKSENCGEKQMYHVQWYRNFPGCVHDLRCS